MREWSFILIHSFGFIYFFLITVFSMFIGFLLSFYVSFYYRFLSWQLMKEAKKEETWIRVVQSLHAQPKRHWDILCMLFKKQKSKTILNVSIVFTRQRWSEYDRGEFDLSWVMGLRGTNRAGPINSETWQSTKTRKETQGKNPTPIRWEEKQWMRHRWYVSPW